MSRQPAPARALRAQTFANVAAERGVPADSVEEDQPHDENIENNNEDCGEDDGYPVDDLGDGADA
ncbi:MAG: hypothetical protein ABIO85_09165 [Sphingomicrobium sp.]